MTLLEEMRNKYTKQINNITARDKEKILGVINKTIESCESSCTIGNLENMNLAVNWLKSEGFKVEGIYDMRDGDYLTISGWDK